MAPDLLSLPYDIRCQIWEYVLGPRNLTPCKCVVAPHYCTITHPVSCFGDFNVHAQCDDRILRVCRAIYDEVQPMVIRTPRVFTVCSGFCLDSLFLSIPLRERTWVKRVNVKVYTGRLEEESLQGLYGAALLKRAELWCGPFVQNALMCSGVGEVVDATTLSTAEEDAKHRRTIWLALALMTRP